MPEKTYKRDTRIIQPAWLDNPYLPENTLKRTRLTAAIWLTIGVIILICDGLALAHFADNYVEALILGVLTVPSSIFVILCALEARK